MLELVRKHPAELHTDTKNTIKCAEMTNVEMIKIKFSAAYG